MSRPVRRYILENEAETDRLERQAKLEHYKVAKELADLPVNAGDVILDAGCGTGVLTRGIFEKWPQARIEACDVSKDRLASAGENSSKKIRFFQANLEQIQSPPDHYHGITSRFVFQHVEKPAVVASELFRITRPGGWIYLIDVDGLFFTMNPMSAELKALANELEPKLPVDVRVGRKLEMYLRNAGFSDISIKKEHLVLDKEPGRVEREMNMDRLRQITPAMIDAIGVNKAERFAHLYTVESKNPDTVFEFFKVFATGYKR